MHIYLKDPEGKIKETDRYIDNRRIIFKELVPHFVPTQLGIKLIKRPYFHSIRNLDEYTKKFSHLYKAKILIVRDEGIGDILLLTPALRALKEKMNVDVFLATNKNYFPIIKYNPYLTGYCAIAGLENHMKNGYHQVIDLRFWSEHSPNRHKVHRSIVYTEKTGIPLDPAKSKPILYIDKETIAKGKKLLNYNEKKNYIAIQLSATHYCRNWSIENYKILSELLIKQNLVPVWIDKEKIDFELKGLINLTGQTDIEEFLGVVANCSLTIGGDSSLYHISGALDVPFIAIFGIISPNLRTTYYDCWHKDIVADLDCIGCGNFHMDKCKITGSEIARCMDLVKPTVVFESVLDYFTNHYS